MKIPLIIASILLIPLVGSAYAATSSDTLDVFMIYSTPNQSCSLQEMQEMNVFVQSTKQYLDKVSTKKIEMSSICTPIEEIKMSEFPLLLKSLNIQRPDLLIILGDTKINEDMVIHMDSLGLWACTAINSDFECVSDLILSCTDCKYGTQEQGLETAVWTVSHELSHYFAVKQPFTNNFYDVKDGVHVLQEIYNYCSTFNQFGPCEGMYYEQSINGQTFRVMNFDYILKNASEMKYFDISVFAHAESNQPTPEVIEEVVSELEIIEEIILEPEITEPLVYVNDEYSFSYTPPKDWISDSDEGDIYLQVSFVPNENPDPQHSIWILALPLTATDISNSSDEKILKEHREFMNENIGSQLFFFEIIKQDFQRYGNAAKITYELDTQVNIENQLLSKKSLWVSWVFDSGEMINIVYSSKQGQYSKYLDEFTASLGSFYVKPELGQISSVQSQMNDEQINRLLGTSWDSPQDSLIDLIINTMNPIFDLVFNLQDNERLQQWGYDIIQRQVGTTEDQIIGQLGYDPRVTCC